MCFVFSFVGSAASGVFLILFFCVSVICTRSYMGELKEFKKFRCPFAATSLPVNRSEPLGPLPLPPPMNSSKSRIPFMRSLSIHFPIYKSSKNDLISDDQLPCCKSIRSILSVTAVPVHLPVINLYYEVREPHDHNSACCTGLFIVISLRIFR